MCECLSVGLPVCPPISITHANKCKFGWSITDKSVITGSGSFTRQNMNLSFFLHAPPCLWQHSLAGKLNTSRWHRWCCYPNWGGLKKIEGSRSEHWGSQVEKHSRSVQNIFQMLMVFHSPSKQQPLDCSNKKMWNSKERESETCTLKHNTCLSPMRKSKKTIKRCPN